MTLVDVGIVAIIVLSTLGAISQGLLRELFSLAGLIIGLVVASWNYARLAVPLSHWIHSQGIVDTIAFLMIAFGIMLIAGLIGSMLRKTVQIIGLGWLDSIFGAVFGFVRGCILVMVTMIAIAAFRPGAPWLEGSALAPYFYPGVRALSAQSPAALKEKIIFGITILEHPSLFMDTIETNSPSHE